MNITNMILSIAIMILALTLILFGTITTGPTRWIGLIGYGLVGFFWNKEIIKVN